METQCFQPSDGTWSEYAALAGLRSVLDPRDVEGIKNDYIDHLHKLAILASGRFDRKSAVLDYGCGTGRISRFLASRVGQVIGVDITPEMIDVAREETKAYNVFYEPITEPRLPLGDASVDAIVSVYVLQYVVVHPHRYRELLREFARVLRPNGRIILIEQASPGGDKSGSLQRSVALQDYMEQAKGTGIRLNRPVAIRLGLPGSWEKKTALSPRLPAYLRKLAIRRTLWNNSRLHDTELLDQPYVDYRIVGHIDGTVPVLS